MDIRLTETQARDLIQYAISCAPYEICGLLAGVGNHVHRVIPIRNVAVDSRHNYEMNPADFVKAMYEIESASLSLLGIYHSHPGGNSIPSPVDIQQAYYPDIAYLIIGLKYSQPRLGAWQIRCHQVDPVRLHIGEQLVAAREEDDIKLSTAQKRAIVISASMAFIIMLILSLVLLPPVTISSLSIR